ncbi:DUF1120 domain-containing protein [Collimonas humicola]|uniref:DUF1120 domain-containing protein n=1 Tax=Collimonas humicola TaxID=2825886 RepID=UPI001B8C7E58|nr:DUF1120 domain-containing protein [Collimonas humicola]
MKLSKQAFVASVMSVAAGSSWSQTTDQLQVVGTIMSPACDVVLSNGGIVDFGDIARSTLSPTATTGIGSKQLDIDVQCNGKTNIAIKTTDTLTAADKPAGQMSFRFEQITPGTVNLATDNIFGLGTSSNGMPIGGYAMRLGNVKVDTATVTVLGYNAAGPGTAFTTGGATFNLSQTNKYFTALTPAAAFFSGENFKFPLDIAVSLDMSSKIPGQDDVRFNGKSTIEVVYL